MPLLHLLFPHCSADVITWDVEERTPMAGLANLFGDRVPKLLIILGDILFRPHLYHILL